MRKMVKVEELASRLFPQKDVKCLTTGVTKTKIRK